ncbi:MAG: hypothetical protein U9N31_02205 [Candidatus Marinimicrobia bacterium]|nr:hypothetical protein [Candidatus Neomarinimicrobiota bacterium]
MDISKKLIHNTAFWRLIAILFGISVFYLGVVRPVQSRIINHWAAPYFESTIPASSVVNVDGLEVDQFNLSGPFKSVKIELPFNGWYWLTLGLLLSARNFPMIKIMSIYHLGLAFVLLLGAHFVISGQYWLAGFFNIHDHIYKVLFLILSLIGLKPVFVNQK